MKKEDVIEIGKLICLDTDEHYQVVNLKDLELVCNEIERRTLERAAVVCEDVTEPAYYGYENTNTFQDGVFACATAIRAMKGKS